MTRTFAAAIFALLALSGPARAATIDLDFLGTISSNSIDTLGLFGTAGNSLTGDTFSANLSYPIPGATVNYPNAFETTVQPVGYTLTINNQTITSASFGPTTSSQIQASTPQGSPGGISVNVQSGRITPGSLDTQLLLSLISPNLFSTRPNLLSPFAYTRQPGDTQDGDQYSIYAFSNKSDFPVENINFKINSLTLSPVPLPAAFPLFGTALAGLAGVGWLKRRKVSRNPRA